MSVKLLRTKEVCTKKLRKSWSCDLHEKISLQMILFTNSLNSLSKRFLFLIISLTQIHL